MPVSDKKNVEEPQKKVPDGFRFDPTIYAEFEDMAHRTGMSKTEILEILIESGGPIIEAVAEQRLQSLREMPSKYRVKTESGDASNLPASAISAAKKIARESEQKRKADKPSGNKP